MLKGNRATPSLILFSKVKRSWNCKNILCGRECTHHSKSGVWRPDYMIKISKYNSVRKLTLRSQEKSTLCTPPWLPGLHSRLRWGAYSAPPGLLASAKLPWLFILFGPRFAPNLKSSYACDALEPFIVLYCVLSVNFFSTACAYL